MTIDQRFLEQGRAFITETLKQVNPSLNVDSGSAINSLLARGGATILATLLQEIDHTLNSQRLNDVEALSTEDMDLLLENLLVTRDSGRLSTGFVRVYYRDRQRRQFASATRASTESRDVYFVTLVDLVYQPEDYLLDTTNGLYYLNMPFVAEGAGEAYNLQPGEINQLVGDNSAPVLVTNPSAMRGGIDSQTNTQALRTAQRAVSTRTPVSRDGVVYWLQSLFGTRLLDLLVIGAGDAEMLRDEVFDLGAGEDPRFQVGVDSLDPVTRAQLGDPQNIHIGGRTDVYLLFDGFNYIQQHVDIFADMTLDSAISPVTTAITATFVTGTTGTVSERGKLLIDLGRGNEETIYYHTLTQVDNNTYTFSDLAPINPTLSHDLGASVKVVNNGELVVGVDKDISILPLFQISEIQLLDPITLQVIGDPIPETTEVSREPGWYVKGTNRYDLMSAKETKTLVIDEKRLAAGNQPLSGTGALADVTLGSGTYSQLTAVGGVDFTGYEGREITLTWAPAETRTRTILVVDSPTQITVSGTALGTVAAVDFSIDLNYADYNQYPVRVSFYTNTELAEAQEFFDTDKRRTVCTDTLVRAYLPAFIDFTLQYRGDGNEGDVRKALVNVLKTGNGQTIGEGIGIQFDYSDLVAAAYTDNLASYVVTPFQVRVRKLQVDGTLLTQYINPGPDTVNALSVRVAPLVGAAFLETKRPSTVAEFNVPSRGRLYLGGFTTNQETLTYEQVVIDGDNQTFILTPGQTVAYAHPADEGLRVATADYEDENLIVDGVITSERNYRPFLGQVVIEKLP